MRNRQKKVTFQDIADYTGFSKTTISRYFNSPDYLTPENRQRISRALEELHYKENKVARILARGRTEYIGLIVPHMFMNFFSYTMDRFLHTYERYGYKYIVFSGGTDAVSERQYIKELLSYQVEGLVILSHMLSSEELASYDVPVVAFEREDRCISSVNTDNYTGGVMAADLLTRSRCDQMIFVCSDSNPQVPAYRRFIGFQDACRRNKVPCDSYFRDSLFTYEQINRFSQDALESILDKYPGKRKGVFCSSDAIANFMLNQLFRQYACLPDDFRIVGFDDSPIAKEAILPFSSVGQQIDLMVDEAMRLLELQIAARKEDPLNKPELVHSMIPPLLVERETT